jgi:hypothetical protein
MTTSGLYQFNATRDQIIDSALRTLGVNSQGEATGTDDRTNLAFALNLIIKALPIETWLLWAYIDLQVPLVSGTSTYTLGPSGTVVGIRPNRIARAWMRNTNNSPATDVPMQQLARSDYDMLTPKQTPGIPVNYYYDPQLTNGVLYTWPVISDAGYTMILSCQRTLQDVASIGSASIETFDIPQEWLLPLKWFLCDEVSHEYSLNLQKVQFIKARADEWREKIVNYTREEEGIYFTPNFQGLGYGL